MKRNVIQPENFFDPSIRDPATTTGQPWSHAVRAVGDFLFISGQLAWGEDGKIVGAGDIKAQSDQALRNLERILKSVGGDLSNVVLTRWFVTSIEDFYKSGAGALRREAFKKNFPTSTLVEIRRLAEPEALVEVETIAVI